MDMWNDGGSFGHLIPGFAPVILQSSSGMSHFQLHLYQSSNTGRVWTVEVMKGGGGESDMEGNLNLKSELSPPSEKI